MNIETRLQSILNRSLNRHVPGIVVLIESGDGEFSWTGTAGAVSADQQYFIASTTKLFTTAILLRLHNERKADLDTQIGAILSREMIEGVHRCKGHECSQLESIRKVGSRLTFCGV